MSKQTIHLGTQPTDDDTGADLYRQAYELGQANPTRCFTGEGNDRPLAFIIEQLSKAQHLLGTPYPAMRRMLQDAFFAGRHDAQREARP